MNTLRGKCVGVAAILLLLVSGYANSEVTTGEYPVRKSYSVAMDSTGDYAVLVATDSSGDYEGLKIVDLDEMSVTRGGFSIAGMDLTFGATLRTLIDNIKLETVFNITTAGAEIVSQVLSDVSGLNEAMATVRQQVAAIETLPATAGSASVSAPSNNAGVGAAGSTAVLVGPGTGISVTDVAPADINLNGLSNDNNFSGVVVSNNKGFTAALHRLTRNAAINAIVSNASGLKVSQKLDIKIEIANTRAARSAAKAAALSRWADSFRR